MAIEGLAPGDWVAIAPKGDVGFVLKATRSGAFVRVAGGTDVFAGHDLLTRATRPRTDTLPDLGDDEPATDVNRATVPEDGATS